MDAYEEARQQGRASLESLKRDLQTKSVEFDILYNDKTMAAVPIMYYHGQYAKRPQNGNSELTILIQVIGMAAFARHF